MKTLLALFCLLCTIPTTLYSQSRPSDTELKVISNVDAIKEGQPLPDILLPNEIGDTIRLSDLKGQYLFLNFWATWCKPCLEHMDFYKAMSHEYEKKGIRFVFISIDKDTEAAKRYISKESIPGINLLAGGFKTPPISYFVVRAQWDGDKLSDYDQGIPRYFMVNKAGVIVNSDLQKKSTDQIQRIIKDYSAKN